MLLHRFFINFAVVKNSNVCPVSRIWWKNPLVLLFHTVMTGVEEVGGEERQDFGSYVWIFMTCKRLASDRLTALSVTHARTNTQNRTGTNPRPRWSGHLSCDVTMSCIKRWIFFLWIFKLCMSTVAHILKNRSEQELSLDDFPLIINKLILSVLFLQGTNGKQRYVMVK